LDAALGLGIAALVVDPEIVAVGDVCHGIGERAEALRVNTFADDAVLKRDVVAATREAETIPAAPFDAAMVKKSLSLPPERLTEHFPLSPAMPSRKRR